jgi:hypothetical protein
VASEVLEEGLRVHFHPSDERRESIREEDDRAFRHAPVLDSLAPAILCPR